MADYYSDSDSDLGHDLRVDNARMLELNSVLRNTNRNLQSCARLVKTYTSLNKENTSVVDKVRIIKWKSF